MTQIHVLMKLLVLFSLLVITPASWGQCAPGIPSAGNPGCIPPNQSNSPYYQAAPAVDDQSRAVWEDRWGAIALDPHSGVAGLIERETSKTIATKEALDQCASKGGVNCEIVLAYHNQCAAVAQKLDGGPIQTSHSPDLDDAKNLAINACGGESECKIMYSSCSLPIRVDSP